MVPLGAPSGMQTEEKKEALGELLRMAREEAPELWEKNTLLSLVLKNIGDDEVILYRLNWFIFIYLFIYLFTPPL